MAGPGRPTHPVLGPGGNLIEDFFKRLFGLLGQPEEAAPPEEPSVSISPKTDDSKRQVLAAKYGKSYIDSLADDKVDQLWLKEISGTNEAPTSVQTDEYWIQILQDPNSSELQKQVASINLGLSKSPGSAPLGRQLTPAELRLQEINVDIAGENLEELRYQKGRRSFKEFADFLAQQIKLGDLKRAEAQAIWEREVDREKMRLEAPQNAANVLKTLGGGAVPAGAQRLPGFSGQMTAPEPFQPYVNAMMPQLPEEAQLAGQVEQNYPQLAQWAQQAAQISGGA